MLAVKVSATATTATDAIAPSIVPAIGTAIAPLAARQRQPDAADGCRRQAPARERVRRRAARAR